MPPVLRAISNWTPLVAAVEAIQSALRQGFPPIGSLVIRLAFTPVAWCLAMRTFRSE